MTLLTTLKEQAIDRAHRIGQQKSVQVHRIIVENTVEDRILALQEKKRELIEAALDENASKSIGRLGVRELGFLFVCDPVCRLTTCMLTMSGCAYLIPHAHVKSTLPHVQRAELFQGARRQPCFSKQQEAVQHPLIRIPVSISGFCSILLPTFRYHPIDFLQQCPSYVLLRLPIPVEHVGTEYTLIANNRLIRTERYTW